MKYLFYVLLLINVVFLAWKLSPDDVAEAPPDEEVSATSLPVPPDAASPPVEEAATVDPASVPPAEGEPIPPSDAEQTPDPYGLATESGISPDGNGCYDVGPVQTREAADGFLQLLKPSAKQARIIVKPQGVPEGWWVLYRKASNLEQARANRQMLEKQGLFDTWLFDKGPWQWSLSLGLYRTREDAEKAARPLLDRSIPVEVTPRRVRGDSFWIRLPWPGSALELEEVVQLLNSQDTSLHIPAPQPCEPAGAQG